MLENEYQSRLIRRIKHMLPGSMILKNDSGYLQGIPDLTVFYKSRWATLEVKVSARAAADRAKEINTIKKARDEAWNSTNRAIDTHKKLVESTINDENKHFAKAAKNVSKYYADQATEKLKKYKSSRNAAKAAAKAAANAKRSW